MANAKFTVRVEGLSAVETAITPANVGEVAGGVMEELIDEASLRFRDDLRRRAPIGRGRLGPYQRRERKPHGTFRKTASRSIRRAGLNTTARVRMGPLANLVRSGTKSHLIQPRSGHRFLNIGGHFIHFVRHPGSRPNTFWDDALGAVGGNVEQLARGSKFSTADRMADFIARHR